MLRDFPDLMNRARAQEMIAPHVDHLYQRGFTEPQLLEMLAEILNEDQRDREFGVASMTDSEVAYAAACVQVILEMRAVERATR